MTVPETDSTTENTNAVRQEGFDFEAALQELEELVSSMESGELSLEDSLESFEKGIRLTRDCQAALKKAEQKVQVLLNDNGDTEELVLPDQDA